MLSKEEIEKAKKTLNELKEDAALFSTGWKDRLKDNEKHAIKTLLQYIDQLEADNYECNNIISDYIEERHKIIDIMKADRMEQLDDYVIYIIEKYLKELGALEDE